ncbi:hypothetical protein EJB05_19152 [Eragrostis curvula]|uniref:Uncharacterized protein n=1 Tax=Eragrostis curvula TaxID=38414 RepID=A0A5J9UVP2_9POAL|nr:hypothetical protein EJB05_19152 [Eragrostis curvula]
MKGILNPMYCPLVYCAQTRTAPEHAITTALSARITATTNTICDDLPDLLMAPSIATSPTMEATKQVAA